MNRYLIPIQNAEQANSVQRIPVEETPVSIYRVDGDGYEVVAEAEGRQLPLGIEDAGVSRQANGAAPVVLTPMAEGIGVENELSTNPVTIQAPHGETQLEQGEQHVITDDCVIELGIGTEIRVNVRDTDGRLDMADGDNRGSKDHATGVAPEAYVRKVTELIRASAKQEAVADCRTHFETLHDTVTERPVADSAHEEVTEELAQFVARLESRIENPLRSADELDEEFIAEVEAITERVETLYAEP
jgi:hypothetical protein